MTEVLSTCEKNFVLKCLVGNKRLDGRSFTEFREVLINFGSEWGCVFVQLGETKVLAQVTCEIAQPRATRPNEGLLYINVNCGLEKRSSEQVVLLTRNLERALKESRCVDLESLCIKAEEKVWKVRVDINIMNHEGNLIDCASVAALAALAHFKRPDVTVSGNEIIVHTHSEKEPIPIVLHHYPVCVSYAIFNDGEIVIADPNLIEEKRAEATVVFGLNSYRELCGLHFGGVTLASLQVLLKCANQGAKRAHSIVKQIKTKLEEDAEKRSNNLPVGFMECLQTNLFDSHKESRLTLKLKHFKLNPSEEDRLELETIKREVEIKPVSKHSAVLLPAEEVADDSDGSMSPTWIPVEDKDEKFYEDPEPKTKKPKKEKAKAKNLKLKQEAVSDDSEEEDTVMLETSEQIS